MSVTPKENPAPWQEGLSNPLQRLSSMYDNAELSDLTITFPNDELSLKVHRLILAMSSPVFEAMFYGPMAEKADLTLPDDPPEAFVFLMGYIYKGNASLPNVDMAVMVYKLANKYQMSSLFSVCSEYLQSRVDLNNLALVYEMSFLYEDSELKQKCRKVVSESREILSSPHIGQLSVPCMEDLLQQKLPVESEVAVFKGLLQWATLQSDNSTTSAKCPKGLRQEIETLLPHIRFLTMTLDDFVEHVMPSGVLTPEESNAIMMNIKRVLNISLPAICSPNRETRVSYSISLLAALSNPDRETWVPYSQLHQISLGRGSNVVEKPTIINPEWAPENVDFRSLEEETFTGQNHHYVERYYHPMGGRRSCEYELLSCVRVNKNIIVGRFEITSMIRYKGFHVGENNYFMHIHHLVIRNSSGYTLREVDVVRNQTGCDINVSAILEEPMLLSSSGFYSIVLSLSPGTAIGSSYYQQTNVALTYGNLDISGVKHCDADLSLAFWCSSNLFPPLLMKRSLKLCKKRIQKAFLKTGRCCSNVELEIYFRKV